MKIAILGTRGIPASYSGFETAAEQLASRLSARGHEVTVYCRPHVVDRTLTSYLGARLVHLPTIRNKYLDTLVHTFLSAVHAGRVTRPDVALFFIAGNSPLCLLTRRAGIPSLINIDGLDSDRQKWPPLAKAYLRFAERNSPRWADEAITDSDAVAEVFERRYGTRIGVVPYGVSDPGPAPGVAGADPGNRAAPGTGGAGGPGILEKLGLDPRRYILFVGRLEPENNPHLLVEAFSRIDRRRARGMKLAIVGGAPYADDYIRQVRRRADPRVVFPGYVFGPGYWELQRNAYLFCAPTEVGGTHPVILEAMAAGNCVLVNDHPPNAETVGDAGIYFSGRGGVDDLTRQLGRLLDDERLVSDHRRLALQRAERYSWDAVTDRYEQLLIEVCARQRPGPLPASMIDLDLPLEPAVAT